MIGTDDDDDHDCSAWVGVRGEALKRGTGGLDGTGTDDGAIDGALCFKGDKPAMMTRSCLSIYHTDTVPTGPRGRESVCCRRVVYGEERRRTSLGRSFCTDGYCSDASVTASRQSWTGARHP